MVSVVDDTMPYGPACAGVASNTSQSPFHPRLIHLTVGSQRRPIAQVRKWLWLVRNNQDNLYTCVAQLLAFCPFFVALQQRDVGVSIEEGQAQSRC